MDSAKNTLAIIVAAGKGARFGGGKSFVSFNNKPLFLWSLEQLSQIKLIDDIFMVFQKEDVETAYEIIHKSMPLKELNKMIKLVDGGKQRQDSVFNALKSTENKYDKILIHDAARPLATVKLISESIDASDHFDGVAPALPISDTVKTFKGKKIINTLNRDNLVSVQTPQCFKSSPLLDSYNRAMKENFYSTDDCALLERYGYSIGIIEGEKNNIKITTQDDLAYAEYLFIERLKN